MVVDSIKSKESSSIDDISAFEKRIGYLLPEDYKEFLLKTNGGSFDCYKVIDTERFGKTSPEMVDLIYGLNSESYSDLDDKFNTYHIEDKRMPDGLIPIAGDPGGNHFCIALGEGKNGEIYFWDHELEVEFDSPEQAKNYYENCFFVCGSFSEFLQKIYDAPEDI